jgi:uncharacterized protein YjbI with pentapeptide repeats
MSATVKIEIKTRWGAKRFECEVDASLSHGRQLGFAVKAAIKARADLSGAVLSGAVLSGAVLRSADLSGAVLSGAVLSGAVLSGAVLRSADLSGADLSGAVLSGAVLSGAVLRSAVLSGAVLRSAVLSGAVLSGAVLKDVKDAALPMAQTSIVPEAGAYIAFKKVHHKRGPAIAKLSIPEDARRSNASGRKCRAEFADVLSINLIDGGEALESAHSGHDHGFIYRVGERVTCHRWDENRWEECSGGIHHFITRIEAENY